MAKAPNNFTAGHLASMAGAYEPQRQMDFEVELELGGNPDFSEAITLSVDVGFLPNESNEEIELHYLNDKVWVAGKYSVDAGTLTCKDIINAPTAEAIAYWRSLVYNHENGKIGLAKDYKKQGSILLYSSEGSATRTWNIEGAWPQAVNWGTLDYSSSEKNQIELTIRYDRAIPVRPLQASLGSGGNA